MLVLSRKKNESVMIGHDVRLTNVEIRRDKVRFGIEAPPHVAVHRSEVYEQIHNAKLPDRFDFTDNPADTEGRLLHLLLTHIAPGSMSVPQVELLARHLAADFAANGYRG